MNMIINMVNLSLLFGAPYDLLSHIDNFHDLLMISQTSRELKKITSSIRWLDLFKINPTDYAIYFKLGKYKISELRYLSKEIIIQQFLYNYITLIAPTLWRLSDRYFEIFKSLNDKYAANGIINVKYTINRFKYGEHTPLCVLITSNSHITAIKSILKYIDVNSCCALINCDLLFDAISKERFDIARLLLAKGYKCSHRYSITPLFVALSNGNFDRVAGCLSSNYLSKIQVSSLNDHFKKTKIDKKIIAELEKFINE